MTISRPDFAIPKRLMASFMRATQEELGAYSLNMLLHNLGMVKDDASPRKDLLLPMIDWNAERLMYASDYAALQGGIRQYYGSGARGALNRIGRSIWHGLVKDAPLNQRTNLLALKMLPPTGRLKRVLECLASQVSASASDISVHTLDLDLVFVDAASASTYQQHSPSPICWATLGTIQAALAWAVGEEQDVEEISCRAAGAEACKFLVKVPPK